MKICKNCNIEKDLTNFDFRKDRNCYSNICKECRRHKLRQHYIDNKTYYINKASTRDKKIRKNNRALIIDYLLANPCIDCGNKDIEVLEFDHRDQSTKLTNVSLMLGYSKTKLLEEINKCDVRCANCHVKKTRRQLGWWIQTNPSMST